MATSSGGSSYPTGERAGQRVEAGEVGAEELVAGGEEQLGLLVARVAEALGGEAVAQAEQALGELDDAGEGAAEGVALDEGGEGGAGEQAAHDFARGGLPLVVEEARVLDKLIFTGNRSFTRRELLDALGLSYGGKIQEVDTQRFANALVLHYRSKGHAFVAIATRVDAAKSEVVYEILEGPRVHVLDVRFHGNREIPGSRFLGLGTLGRQLEGLIQALLDAIRQSAAVGAGEMGVGLKLFERLAQKLDSAVGVDGRHALGFPCH